ncbi:hypothetical protein N2K95_06925 [Arthrobacter zhaoxinii]|uniref:Antitoxin VbhA domain-containing protein n=1 Tax=Arthrobacter zhaoxinii TaxID=2964616 RepID=A0ABY5YTC8_9MICC|nr:hypothetical protein [Arthrobacter zhaoxinii]UWX98376.1 hypothetical protein N2K95_06925 [Arthrobacter zhaoxinii]
MTSNTSHDRTPDKARTDLGRLDHPGARHEAAAAKEIQAVPPGFSGATPSEIAARYAAGDIDRAEMIRQLSTWPYAKKQDSAKQLATEWKAILPPEERGTFDEVAEAFDRGLIDAEAYDTILEASD